MASAADHIGDLDTMLIEDGTYFVHEADRRDRGLRRLEQARPALHRLRRRRRATPACWIRSTEPARVRAMFVRSDWTRRGLGRAILDSCARAAQDEGFTQLALMATLPGEPLYRACGFREVRRTLVTTPDGVSLEGVVMERPVEV